jgi:hypothetical protein
MLAEDGLTLTLIVPPPTGGVSAFLASGKNGLLHAATNTKTAIEIPANNLLFIQISLL